MTAPHPIPGPGISWDELAHLTDMANLGQWDPVRHPEWRQTLDRCVALVKAGPEGQEDGEAEPAEPPLPPGEFATVHMLGHVQETGWVSDGTRAGVPVLVIRDWEGNVKREVPGHALYQYVPHPTPLRRPDPEPLAALPAGEEYGGPLDMFADGPAEPLPAHHFDERYDEDSGEPADVFPGRVDPDAAF